jgi:hypothetical protein
MCEKISSFNSEGRVSNVDIVMSFAGFEAPNLTGLLGDVSHRLKGEGLEEIKIWHKSILHRSAE